MFNGRRDILALISVDEAESLHALSIEEESGNIAVCDRETVFIYEPSGRDYGDLRWTRTRDLPSDTESPITYLSWGSPDELLVAGERLALWSFADEDRPQVIWNSELSSSVSIACFSPDAGLIASCAQHDRMVKIWRRLSYEQDSTRFDVSYLPHPSAVTNLSWRKVWHQEQNLDNLLYTYCADNQVRAWAHSDHYARSTMEMVSTIDTNESIQPRRLSMSSVSKSRFTFILHSRDLSRAAERALQAHRQGTDHALEHLIEIANRSPEICVVLDARGHMSVWGLENAGYKNKQTAEKFNVALVDGVDIHLPDQISVEDLVQIQAFANNDLSASLCILVHSHSGQIDWYQGSFTHFFDTAARERRIQLHSSWSGHASAIDNMVSSQDYTRFISWTSTKRAIVWVQSATGALLRKSRLSTKADILDAILLSTRDIAITLSRNSIDVWNIQALQAHLIHHVDLDSDRVSGLVLTTPEQPTSPKINFGVIGKCLNIQLYCAYLPIQSCNAQSNGYHQLLSSLGETSLQSAEEANAVCNYACSASATGVKGALILTLDQAGTIKVHDRFNVTATASAVPSVCFNTYIRPSALSSICDSFAAVVHEDLRTISIWNVKQACNDFCHTFSEYDEVQGLHWHVTENGFHLLAVRFTYTVVILSQRRYSSDHRKSAWAIQQVVRSREHSNLAIGSLCWLEPCQIVLGAGNQILVFDVEAVQRRVNSPGQDTRKTVEINCAQEIILYNSSLPSFHPDTLASLFQTRRYPAIETILAALQDELRFAVEGDTVPSDLGQSSSDKVAIREYQNCTDNISSDFDIEEGTSRLREGINKISLNQLSATHKRQLHNLLGIYARLHENRKSMDAFALTYLYHFLLATSTLQTDASDLPPLPYKAIVAASLSQTQESLVHFIHAHFDRLNTKLTWPTARSLGLFLFLNPSSPDDRPLHIHLETIARNEYNRHSDDRNPVNCSLYYLALNKKAILQSLWRTTVGVREKENTMKLLAHDFAQQKWKATALKNAYALLSRRRFLYAAAFFLLGGSLSDACNVCTNQLHDIQLAIAIARVWDGDKVMQEKAMRTLLEKNLIEAAIDSHQARWMAIWAAVHTGDYARAMLAIVQSTDQLFEAQYTTRRQHQSDEEQKRNNPFKAMSWQANEPTLLVDLYVQLRSRLIGEGKWTVNVITPRQEWAFVMRCVNWYDRAGLHWLALRLVSDWEFVDWQREKASASATSITKEDIRTVAVQEGPISMLDAWVDDTPRKEIEGKKPDTKGDEPEPKPKPKPPPTQFFEPSADSLLDSFGF